MQGELKRKAAEEYVRHLGGTRGARSAQPQAIAFVDSHYEKRAKLVILLFS